MFFRNNKQVASLESDGKQRADETRNMAAELCTTGEGLESCTTKTLDRPPRPLLLPDHLLFHFLPDSLLFRTILYLITLHLRVLWHC